MSRPTSPVSIGSTRSLGRRPLLWAAAAAAGAPWALLGGRVHAQDFPTRPVRLVMGFPAGGSGDFVGRTIGEEAAKLLGQTVLPDNRPGAATNLASEAVARAEPDGHTLLLGGSFSHSVNPALFSKLPYDPQRDFTPILKVASLPTIFAVPATLGVNTLAEFIALARQRGSQWNYASAGIGSPGHIAGGYFTQATGLSLLHVPYKGASEAVRALVAGEVQLTITSPPSVMAFVREGRLKALALTTPGRSRLLPDIPGSDEAGLKDFNLDGWYGLFAPARTPPAVVQRLYTVFADVLKQPAVVAKLESQAATPEPSASAEAFARFVVENRAAWEQIVKRSGAQVG
jgi:tripartite-type tricarboxylate transporter receptor subunit TctC